MLVREVLHAHIPLLTASSSVRDAIDKLDIYQFPGIVIIDENRYPIAVLTEGDLCRAVGQRDSLREMENEPAMIHATKSPQFVSGETEISEAFHFMIRSGLTVLPIVDDNILAGIVLRVDLMQALLIG